MAGNSTKLTKILTGAVILLVVAQTVSLLMFFRLTSLHDDLFLYVHSVAGNVNTLQDCVERGINPCDMPNRL